MKNTCIVPQLIIEQHLETTKATGFTSTGDPPLCPIVYNVVD